MQQPVAAGWASGGPAKGVSSLISTYRNNKRFICIQYCKYRKLHYPHDEKTGYKGEFAAAVEAAASTGGQIMPPVMGSAAFLISDAVGIPYSTLMKHTIIPAILYFTGIWVMVHLEAKRSGLKGIPRDQLAPLCLCSGPKVIWYSRLFAIIYFMLSGFTITRSALWGILIAVIIPFIKKDTKVPVKQIISALPAAARGIVSVATACANSRYNSWNGYTYRSGSENRGRRMFDVVGGSLILGLMCAMLTSLILGMGVVSTTSNYIITSTVAAPILIKMGVPLLASHLFCFYSELLQISHRLLLLQHMQVLQLQK